MRLAWILAINFRCHSYGIKTDTCRNGFGEYGFKHWTLWAFRGSLSSGERTQWVPFILLFVCVCVNANSPSFSQNSPSLSQNSVRLSGFSSPKQCSRNSIPPVSYKSQGSYAIKAGGCVPWKSLLVKWVTAPSHLHSWMVIRTSWPSDDAYTYIWCANLWAFLAKYSAEKTNWCVSTSPTKAMSEIDAKRTLNGR